MNGSHSGSGTVKSAAVKNRRSLYRSARIREKNRDRRAASIKGHLSGLIGGLRRSREYEKRHGGVA